MQLKYIHDDDNDDEVDDDNDGDDEFLGIPMKLMSLPLGIGFDEEIVALN